MVHHFTQGSIFSSNGGKVIQCYVAKIKCIRALHKAAVYTAALSKSRSQWPFQTFSEKTFRNMGKAAISVEDVLHAQVCPMEGPCNNKIFRSRNLDVFIAALEDRQFVTGALGNAGIVGKSGIFPDAISLFN